MQVPLIDLKAQFDPIRQDILSAVEEVIDSHIFRDGPRVEQIERAIADYCCCSHAVGVSSGTDAIINSLMSLGIGPGDEVITTPFTFFAAAGCLVRAGATPVFVDIEPGTFNIDPSQIGPAITDKTKAILPVHLFGQTADMDPILSLAGEHGLSVIEDAAQCIGASYRTRPAGSMGTCGCFSFYPSKNLSAAGDAGMIVTNDAELADKLKLLRNHGDESTYKHRFVGGNFRLDAIQAAVLLVKLPHLAKWNRQRQDNAAHYDQAFADCSRIGTPVVKEGNVSVYHLYIIRMDERDSVVEHLRKNRVGCGVYYPLPLHMQECFARYGYKEGAFPQAEKAAREVLAIPVYPELTNEQRAYVVERVLQAVGV